MKKAENVMDKNPEEALSILDSIDATQLKRYKDKALYSLLITMARDKNNRFEKNDSLISTAVSYYDNSVFKDRKHRMWSHYYNGVINLYNRNYPVALSEGMIALSLCKEDWYFALAKINDMIADIYYSSYNVPTAIEYRKKAVSNFILAGKKLHAFYASDDLGKALMACDSIDRARTLLDSLHSIQDADLEAHKDLISCSRIYLYLQEDSCRKALNEFYAAGLANKPGFTNGHYGVIALMFAKNNLPDSAYKYLDREKSINQHFSRNGWYNKTKYELSKRSGDYRNIYISYLYMDSISNLNVKESLNRNLALREAEFYLNEKQLAEKSQKLWLTIAVIAITVVIILLMSIYILRQKAQLRQIRIERIINDFVSDNAITTEADNPLTDRLRNYISDKKEEFDIRDKKLTDKESAVRQREEMIAKFSSDIKRELSEDLDNRKRMVGQFIIKELEPLSRIASQYFGNYADDSKRLKFRKELDNAVERINSDTNYKWMLEFADSVNGGLIGALKEQVPKLDERDIKYIVFYLAGFSTNLIAILLEITPVNCRTIKRRIISKIRNSGSEKAQRLLRQLFGADPELTK